MVCCLMHMSYLMLINHPCNKAGIFRPAACTVVAFAENQKIALCKMVRMSWSCWAGGLNNVISSVSTFFGGFGEPGVPPCPYPSTYTMERWRITSTFRQRDVNHCLELSRAEAIGGWAAARLAVPKELVHTRCESWEVWWLWYWHMSTCFLFVGVFG